MDEGGALLEQEGGHAPSLPDSSFTHVTVDMGLSGAIGRALSNLPLNGK
ncbi:hypothetical protein K7W42_19265 [Deinococcus sp. HMF7604]|nr:hypothetical protein [Deinococcus betulae]MBZ9752981.1 hypothetical protein [Deinococcus betulae]